MKNNLLQLLIMAHRKFCVWKFGTPQVMAMLA
jgi:hypothetical protein